MKPLRGLFIFGSHTRGEVRGGVKAAKKNRLTRWGTSEIQLIENTNRENIVLNSLCVGGPK